MMPGSGKSSGNAARNRRTIGALIAGLCALGGTAAAQVPAKAGPDMTAAEITNAVSDALYLKDGVPDYAIDVHTQDGIVTLSGAVDNIMAAERAVRVAETVRGVRGVVDEITIADMGRPDKKILEDVREALHVDPATDSWNIQASVNEGLVTLKGTVSSWQEKRLAGEVTKSVRGVRGLNNEIDVNYRMPRTDAEIRGDIVDALHWDALVDDALIKVHVKDGHVTLSGMVGSAAEKREARLDAWVMGVQSVDTSGLDVASWKRDPRFRTEKYVIRTDDQVRQAVKDALARDPRVSAGNVTVSVEGGVVSLSGAVNSLKAKLSAGRTAHNVVGVWRVKNRINVRPTTPSDTAIADHIRAALARNPYVNRFDMSVAVVNGDARLSGTVDTYFEKAQAGDVAAGVYGVVQVENHLAVRDDHDTLTYDPYVDDWYPFDYHWYVHSKPRVTRKSDWEIRDDLEYELWWSPFINSDEVSVSVSGGAVTLTGTVDTWNERQAATEDAYEAGAVAVSNDLKVRYGPAYYLP